MLQFQEKSSVCGEAKTVWYNVERPRRYDIWRPSRYDMWRPRRYGLWKGQGGAVCGGQVGMVYEEAKEEWYVEAK